jgi:phosphoglycerate dehydrogenase-like enzyme
VTDRPLVIQTEELEPAAAAWLAERADLVICPHTDAARLDSLLPRAQGLVVRTYTRVDGALLAKAPRLRVVGRAGVALENIDLSACRHRGIQVVHTPGANTRAVVELVTAFMLDALRPRVYLNGPLEGKAWHEARNKFTADTQLSDLTLGLWGFGRIGSAMARIGTALDMRVIYNDLLDVPTDRRSGASPVDVPTLLRTSDILSVHVDFRESNRNMIGRREFASMKPSVLFINTSRGLVVDAAEMTTHFRAHPRAQAYIDVHDPAEPIPPTYAPLGVPNIRLTPHLASGTKTAKANMSWVVRDVWRVLSGDRPENPAPHLEPFELR